MSTLMHSCQRVPRADAYFRPSVRAQELGGPRPHLSGSDEAPPRGDPTGGPDSRNGRPRFPGDPSVEGAGSRSPAGPCLPELGALSQTLRAAADGVYAPPTNPDRLLRGLPGLLADAELHLLRGRLLVAREPQAPRGELTRVLPVGLIRPSEGPGGQAHRADVGVPFSPLGSRRHPLLFPPRPFSGPRRRCGSAPFPDLGPPLSLFCPLEVLQVRVAFLPAYRETPSPQPPKEETHS